MEFEETPKPIDPDKLPEPKPAEKEPLRGPRRPRVGVPPDPRR